MRRENSIFKQKKVLVTLILIAAMTVLGLAACSSKDNSEQQTGQEQTDQMTDSREDESEDTSQQPVTDEQEGDADEEVGGEEGDGEDAGGEEANDEGADANEEAQPVIVAINIYSDDIPQERQEYDFDGNLTRTTYYDSFNGTGEPVTMIEYSYDAEGRLELGAVYRYHDGIVEITQDTVEYSYDEAGNLIGERYITDEAGNTWISYEYQYEYDEKGRLSYTIRYYYDGDNRELDWECTRVYNDISVDEELIQENEHIGGGFYLQRVFDYDEEGRICEALEYDGGEVISERIYHYDENGNLAEEIYDRYGIYTNVITYEYEYAYAE